MLKCYATLRTGKRIREKNGRGRKERGKNHVLYHPSHISNGLSDSTNI
jgi:hypothetical protein